MKLLQPFLSFGNFVQRHIRPNGNKPGLPIIAALLTTALFIIALGLSLFASFIQWLWNWLIPDLFPGVVQNGTLAGSISWWTAFKMVVVLVVITSVFKGGSIQVQHNQEKDKNVPAGESKSDSPANTNFMETNPRVFPTLVDPLTDRELEVLELLARGLTNQQIANQLNVSESTVVYHIGHIFGKLRVSSRVEAAVWAKERGII